MLTTEDRLDIADLIARFTQCSDYADWNTLSTLFTPDVVTELDGLPVRYEGIEQQVEHARESDRQAEGKNRHFNFNMTITERDGRIYADYAFMNVNAGHAPMTSQIVVTGRMQDRVEKTPDGWKIAHRFVRFDQKFNLDF